MVLWLVLRDQDFDMLKEKILGASFGILIFSRVFTFIAAIVRAARWQLLIKPLGQSPTLLHTFYAIMVGYLFNMGLPRMGEFFRCWSLQKTDNIAIDKLLGTVVAERLIDVLVLLCIVVFVFFSRFALVRDYFQEIVFTPLLRKLDAQLQDPLWLIVGIIVLLSLTLIGLFLLRKLAKGSFGQKVLKMISGFKDGLVSIWHMKEKLQFLGYTFGMWFCYLLAAFTAFFAFSETAALKFVDGILVLALGGIGMAAPVQGGLGAYHGAVSQGLILLGINAEEAAAFAILVHGAMTAFVILAGVFSLFMVWRKTKS